MRILPCKDGGAALEFALVLPLFILLLFGTADFGFVLYTQAVMQNAAREAVRRMAVDQTLSTTDAQTYAQTYLQSWPLTFTITASRPTCTIGTATTTCALVRVTVPMASAALMGGVSGPFKGNLAAQVTMQQEI